MTLAQVYERMGFLPSLSLQESARAMASVSKATADDVSRVRARGAGGDGQTRSEGVSIGVILGFPAEIAEELQRWRASSATRWPGSSRPTSRW